MPRFRTHPPQSCIVSKPHPEYEFRARFSVSHIQCGACELGPSIGAKEPTVLRYVCATGRCRRTSFFCSLPKKLPRQWFSQHLLSPSRELMFRMKRPTTSAWAPNHMATGLPSSKKQYCWAPKCSWLAALFGAWAGRWGTVNAAKLRTWAAF